MKILNIFSYALNVILIAFIVVSYCISKNTVNKDGTVSDKISAIKASIADQERANLPITIQNFEHVYNINIDSLVITNDIEPYVGYLVTTWDYDEKQDLNANEWARNNYKDKYIRKTEQVYVQVSDISTNENSVTWNTNWTSSYFSVVIR